MLNIVMNIIMWYQLVAWGVANRSHPPITRRKTWRMAEGGGGASAKPDSGLLKHQVVSPASGKVIKLPQHEILGACRSVSDFEKLNRIGEGTYGIVYRAKDLKSGDIVALKKIRMEREKEGTRSLYRIDKFLHSIDTYVVTVD